MRFIARHILSSRRRWRWGALIVLGLIVVLLLVLTGRAWGLREWTAQVLSQLRVMGAPVFFAAMAVLPSVGFPLLPFAVTAGPAFSPALGVGGVIACAILAVGLNVALSYVLASSLFRPPVQRLIARLGYQLPDPQRHNPWLLTLLVRVAPGSPFWLQSEARGVVRVRFGA